MNVLMSEVLQTMVFLKTILKYKLPFKIHGAYTFMF